MQFHMPTAGCTIYLDAHAIVYRRVDCQNWNISKASPNPARANYISPESLVRLADRTRCNGMSFSFNEPSTSLFEYSLDVMRIAKTKGLYNTYVTNLYSTLEALRLIVKSGCDAFCVNVKGDASAVKKYCGADAEIVWRNLRELRKLGKHIEIVTLVIPTVNDNEATLRAIASRIRNDLGADVPWHCTRYFAAYKSSEFGLPDLTPVSSLEEARKIGLEEGLKFTYVGNVVGHKGENTYCPNCEKLLIERFGLSLRYHEINLTDNSCSNCHHKVSIAGKCS